MIARGLAVASGSLILAAVAHVTVIATGGYGTPHSYLTIAIAFGVACGSVFSGMAWSIGRCSLAVFFVACIAGGEAYGVMQTANRLVAASEHTQVPLREHAKEYARARERVEAAEARVKNVPTTSKRLTDALAAKASADAAVVAKSSERGCRENCRQLLQAQVGAAAEEVEKARAELESSKTAADTTLVSARRELDSLKAPESATPLADRTGIAAWILDLITASLGSIAANGLACCLMIFGAHHSGRRVELVTAMPIVETAMPVVDTVESNTPVRAPEPASEAIILRPKDHVARFAIECMRPGGTVELRDIQKRYSSWNTGRVQYSRAQVAQALAQLFEDAGIAVEEVGGRLVAVGVSLKEPIGALVAA
jgi:hypothetical protein